MIPLYVSLQEPNLLTKRKETALVLPEDSAMKTWAFPSVREQSPLTVYRATELSGAEVGGAEGKAFEARKRTFLQSACVMLCFGRDCASVP